MDVPWLDSTAVWTAESYQSLSYDWQSEVYGKLVDKNWIRLFTDLMGDKLLEAQKEELDCLY